MCLFALFGAPRSQINLLGCAQDLQQLGTEIFLPFFFCFSHPFSWEDGEPWDGLWGQ